MKKAKMPKALLALTLSSFAIGVAEFIPLGLLPNMAKFFNIELSNMGMVVTLYAIGVAIGAPILTNLISNFSRKNQLLFTLLLFSVGNFIGGLALSYNMLILGRIISGLAHGVFFTIGSTIASDVSEPHQKSKSIALMFTGLTVAIILGVPLGTLIGKMFNWKASFILVGILGLIGFILSYILTPKNLKKNAQGTLKDQLSVLTNSKLILSYLITIFGYGGSFVFLTFISPFLEKISGFTSNTVMILLLVYGVAVAIGNIYGGKLSDKVGTLVSLKWLFMAQIIVFALFFFTASFQVLAVINLILIGLLQFAIVPPLQLNIVEVASKYAPKAIDTASGLNISAFNIGIAGASVIGGEIINLFGLKHTSYFSSIIVILALGLVSLILGFQNQKQMKKA